MPSTWQLKVAPTYPRQGHLPGPLDKRSPSLVRKGHRHTEHRLGQSKAVRITYRDGETKAKLTFEPLGQPMHPSRLDCFVETEAPIYRQVVLELSNGRKPSHWMPPG